MMATLRIILAILAAYTAACAVVAFALILTISDVVQGNAPRAFLVILLLAAAFSAPGFILLRLGLWWSAREHFLWFASAGALGGIIALSLATRTLGFAPRYAAIGLAAGAAYWLVERGILGKVLVRVTRGMA